MQFRDTQNRYGGLSRAFHWGMALLFVWQFLTVIARVLFEDSALDNLLWGSHKPLGLVLMVLVVLRLFWALANRASRPPSLNLPARLGHLALYLLMVLVPLLALMRQYGSGRSFEPFGLPLMAGFEGDKIEWLMTPGNWLHGNLGWALLALIVGHISLAMVHRRRPQDNVLPRMLGRPVGE